jgi:hypothetical protein
LQKKHLKKRGAYVELPVYLIIDLNPFSNYSAFPIILLIVRYRSFHLHLRIDPHLLKNIVVPGNQDKELRQTFLPVVEKVILFSHSPDMKNSPKPSVDKYDEKLAVKSAFTDVLKRRTTIECR